MRSRRIRTAPDRKIARLIGTTGSSKKSSVASSFSHPTLPSLTNDTGGPEITTEGEIVGVRARTAPGTTPGLSPSKIERGGNGGKRVRMKDPVITLGRQGAKSDARGRAGGDGDEPSPPTSGSATGKRRPAPLRGTVVENSRGKGGGRVGARGGRTATTAEAAAAADLKHAARNLDIYEKTLAGLGLPKGVTGKGAAGGR